MTTEHVTTAGAAALADMAPASFRGLCRNRLCCNPDHLELVTNQENARRSVAAIGAAGRGKPGWADGAPRDTCKYGHPLSGENLSFYTPSDGYTRRVCRACARRAQLEWRERQRRAS